MPTPNFGLPLYGDPDTAELDTLLNGQSSQLDAALTANIWNFGGTDAQRTAMTSPLRRDGIRFRTTDTDRDWFYDGSNWISADAGGYLIRPTTVVGATVNSAGKIIPTAGVSSVSVNGVFSSRFRRFRVEFNLYSATADSRYLRLRAAGADFTTATYYQRGTLSSTAVLYVSGEGITQWNLTAIAAQRGMGSLEFEGMMGGSQSTKQINGAVSSVTGTGHHTFGGFITSVEGSSFDGFTIFNATGNTFSASDANHISVYGIA